jgi:Oxidoreductase family, NAD-binding Rossmann fold
MVPSEVRLDSVAPHSELEAILRMPEIDVVDICLPLRLHYDWTKRALQAGKHDCRSMTLEEDPLDGYLREIEYFIQCVRKHSWPDECDPESSLEAVELGAIYLEPE